MKRILALTLSLFLLLPILGACGEKEEAVFTYEGYTITASQYNYWISSYKTEILQYHSVRDSESFWKTELTEGVTMEEYYTPIIDGVVKNYCIAQALYRKYGLAISADVKKAINDDIDEKIELYGSRAQVNEALAPLGINISGLKEIYTIQEKYNTLYRYLFGDEGTMAATADEVEAYYNANYHRMKYIVFETTEPVKDKDGKLQYDSTGTLITQKCSEEEILRRKNLLEDLKTRAGLGDEQAFEELIKEYSAFDLSDYENGLFVSANEASSYGSQIVNALQELNAGQCAIIEEEGYLFLIRKYEPIPFKDLSETDIKAQLANLQAYTAQQLCAAMFAELHGDVIVNEEVKSRLALSLVTASTDRNF